MNAPARTTLGEICGVRTLHVDKPGLTRATLYIGVGWADETFATRGVTHVVEHLVMHGTTRGRFETNATVMMYRTAFWATGRPDQVAGFLNEVTAAIRSLPLDRLGHEARVLAAEASEPGYGPHEAMLQARYGNAGPGLGMFWGNGPLAMDPAVAGEHLRRWFVRENAVLAVAGPMPDGLEIALPDGEIPERSFAEVGTAGVVTGDVGDPVLSFVVPEGPAVGALTGAMATRLEEELRHAQGHVYGIEPEAMRLPGTGTVLVQIASQCAPGAAAEVGAAMARELAHRAETGLTLEERDEMLEWWDVAEQDEGGEQAELEIDAERLLSGLAMRSRAEARADAEVLDPAAVAAIVREARAGALLLVPEDALPATDLPSGGRCSVSSTMTTAPLRRRFRSDAPRGSALGFDGEVVEYRDEHGDVHAIGLDEVVGVGVAGRSRELFGRRGCVITVDGRDFAGAEAIVRAIDERVPQGYRFDIAAWLGGR